MDIDKLNSSLQRHWYTSFCNDNEIDRILTPQSPKDFLLQERANIVADHTRFLRVYMNKARVFRNWSFEKSFSEVHYHNVLNHLTPEDFAACQGAVKKQPNKRRRIPEMGSSVR